MTISPTIFKGYDIRGIYPTELNEENIVPVIKAIYTFFYKENNNKRLDIVIGTDMRTSSPALTKVAIQTLVDLGAHVIDVGVVSTPTFYFSVFHYNFDAGIQITASHNPKEWNGAKMVKRGANGLIKIGKSTGLDTIKQMAISGESIDPMPGGSVTKKDDVLIDDVANALRIAGNPTIKKFKIVADAANAMGSQYIDAVFGKVEADLIRMNFTLDGTFPAHQPDPLQKETLVDLQKKVVEEKADLGLAPDGDGDRLFFVDEKGNIVPPTIITAIVTKELLKSHPGETIFADIRYIFTPKKIISENGGKIKITKVGHAYITEAMNTIGGIFAGESSAHYFFKDAGNAESQMPIILIVLKVLTEKNKPFSEVIEEYRRSFESGEINFKTPDSDKILEMAKQKYADGTLDLLDGVAINYPNWRFSLRISNTESLLRLNIEAYDKATMEQKRDELIQFIKSCQTS